MRSILRLDLGAARAVLRGVVGQRPHPQKDPLTAQAPLRQKMNFFCAVFQVEVHDAFADAPGPLNKMKRKLNEQDVPEAVIAKNGERDTESKATFAGFDLDSRLLQAVNREKFAEPTPVQAKAIPLALDGKDVLGMTTSTNLLLLKADTSQPAPKPGPARHSPTSSPS